MRKYTRLFMGVSLAVVMCLSTTIGAYAASFRNTFTVGADGTTAGTTIFADSNFANLGSNPDSTYDHDSNTETAEIEADGFLQYNYATITGESGTLQLQHNGGSGQFIKQIDESGNKALQIARQYLTRVAYANETEANLAAKHYRVDMNFKITNCENTAAYTTILESSVAANSKRIGVHIARNTNGKLTYKRINDAGDDTTTIEINEDIVNDKWYNLSIEVDIPNQRQSIWLNGRKIVEGVKLYIDDKSGIPAEGTTYTFGKTWHPARIVSGETGYNLTNKMIIIDDIKIYEEPTGYEKFYAEDFSNMKGQSVTDDEPIYGEKKSYNSWSNCSVDNDGVLIASTDNGDTWATFRLGTNKVNDAGNLVGTAYAAKLDFMVPTAEALNKGTKNILIIRGDGSNNGFRAGISSGKLFGCNIEPNQWYTLVMYADITNIDYEAETGAKGAAYLAKKGDALKCVAPNLSFGFNSNAGGDKLYRVFEFNIANSTVHFDNIAIYEDVREADLATAAAAFGNANTLATNNKTITIPTTATSGYTLSWTKGGNAVSGNETAVFGDTAQTVTYTASAKDNADTLTATRGFDISIPAKYDLDLNVSGSSSVGTITVNANSDSDDGYKNGIAILALYEGGVLKHAEYTKVTSGTASLSYDPKRTGTFTSTLFLWVDETLKPVAIDTETFTFENN